MDEFQCNIFSDAVSNVRCDKRYVNFSIPDRVLNWAANDYFGVSTNNLLKSPTFKSVLDSHIGCEYNSGKVTVGNRNYDANLRNHVDTVDIISGPKYNAGTETYVIDGIILTENQINLITDELALCVGKDNKAAKKWIGEVEDLLKFFTAKPGQCKFGKALAKEWKTIISKGKICTNLKTKANALSVKLNDQLRRCR